MENYLDDIVLVGQTKLLGYLPIETIHNCGSGVQEMIELAQSKGLECFEFSDVISNIHSGSLFVADIEGLQLFLNQENATLRKYGWSVDAREYVKQVATEYAEPQDLFELVALTFGDKRKKYQTRSAIAEIAHLRK